MSTAESVEQFIEVKRAATGRSCGSCSLCCKLLPIRELDKPENQWCVHCRPGQGCGIHAERPETCRAFACEWLVNADLGDDWFPTRAKMFVHYNVDPLGTLGVYIVVDPSRPDAWRREPYFSHIKTWALQNLRAPRKMRIYVVAGRQMFLVLPDAPVETTNKFHIVVPTGPDRWEARCFDTREEAMAAQARLRAAAR